jgi:hypothetical protein
VVLLAIISALQCVRHQHGTHPGTRLSSVAKMLLTIYIPCVCDYNIPYIHKTGQLLRRRGQHKLPHHHCGGPASPTTSRMALSAPGPPVSTAAFGATSVDRPPNPTGFGRPSPTCARAHNGNPRSASTPPASLFCGPRNQPNCPICSPRTVGRRTCPPDGRPPRRQRTSRRTPRRVGECTNGSTQRGDCPGLPPSAARPRLGRTRADARRTRARLERLHDISTIYICVYTDNPEAEPAAPTPSLTRYRPEQHRTASCNHRCLVMGSISRAARCLETQPILDPSEDVFNRLCAVHPQELPPPVPTPDEPPATITEEILATVLKAVPKGSAAG